MHSPVTSRRARRYFAQIFSLACLCLTATGHAQNEVKMFPNEDYLKQDGLIEVPATPDNPMPGRTAIEAIERLAASRDDYRREKVSEHDRALVYTPIVLSPKHIWNYIVFDKDSPYYPAVVRRSLAKLSDHLEIHRTILCEASAEACGELRRRIGLQDRFCGRAIPGCLRKRPGEAAALAALAALPVAPTEQSEPSETAKDQPSKSFPRVYSPTAEYPIQSLVRREEGDVIIRARINREGLPYAIQVDKSSGFPLLDLAAVEAEKQAMYNVTSATGKWNSPFIRAPYNFRLNRTEDKARLDWFRDRVAQIDATIVKALNHRQLGEHCTLRIFQDTSGHVLDLRPLRNCNFDTLERDPVLALLKANGPLPITGTGIYAHHAFLFEPSQSEDEARPPQ